VSGFAKNESTYETGFSVSPEKISACHYRQPQQRKSSQIAHLFCDKPKPARKTPPEMIMARILKRNRQGRNGPCLFYLMLTCINQAKLAYAASWRSTY
jgi:hypothetical protein